MSELGTVTRNEADQQKGFSAEHDYSGFYSLNNQGDITFDFSKLEAGMTVA